MSSELAGKLFTTNTTWEVLSNEVKSAQLGTAQDLWKHMTVVTSSEEFSGGASCKEHTHLPI